MTPRSNLAAHARGVVQGSAMYDGVRCSTVLLERARLGTFGVRHV